MGPKTEELIGTLEQLATLLESDGDTHWSLWMRNARSRLLQSDYSGIEYLLKVYGGMGSFNDVVLGQRFDGRVLSWKSDHVELNEEFSKLREKAAGLAHEIERSQA